MTQSAMTNTACIPCMATIGLFSPGFFITAMLLGGD